MAVSKQTGSTEIMFDSTQPILPQPWYPSKKPHDQGRSKMWVNIDIEMHLKDRDS